MARVKATVQIEVDEQNIDVLLSEVTKKGGHANILSRKVVSELTNIDVRFTMKSEDVAEFFELENDILSPTAQELVNTMNIIRQEKA